MSTLGFDLERLEHYDPNYKLDLGAVTSRAFGVWIANFIPFTVLAYALNAPVYGLSWLLAQPGVFDLPRAGADLLLQLLSGLARLVLTGAVTYGVFEHLRGERASMSAILSTGFARVVPVLGTAILAGLATTLATCALIIPGIIVACQLFVAVPVVVIERVGAWASLSRSRDLTAGNRWSVLGLAIVIGLVVGLPAFVIAVGWVLLHDAAPSRLHTTIIGALVLPLSSFDGSMRAVCYHDLRVGREGAAVEDLVKVFE